MMPPIMKSERAGEGDVVGAQELVAEVGDGGAVVLDGDDHAAEDFGETRARLRACRRPNWKKRPREWGPWGCESSWWEDWRSECMALYLLLRTSVKTAGEEFLLQVILVEADERRGHDGSLSTPGE